MFPRRFSELFQPANTNLKNAISKGEFQKILAQKLIRPNIGGFRDFLNASKKFHDILRSGQLFKVLLAKPVAPKTHRTNVLKVWAYHCECVFAQRLRRCQQMFSLYSKWWEEKALKEFIRKLKQNITKRGKCIALASAAVYNWDQHRISTDEIKKNENQFDYINILKENTICLACDPTKKDKDKDSICKCGKSGMPSNRTYDDWVPFVEKTDLVIWRRLHASGSGHYEYKMFGTYNDVTAEDFLNVQVDIDYRRKWDTTAVQLKQGESEELTNSDIIYWEMLWPRLFVNRDYVFNRRYLIDETKKILYIMSKSTSHPNFPKYADKYRIEDYFSCMVIRPYSDLNKPGLEFVLTYYDNPGVNVPGSVTTWATTRAMPDFLDKLRDATRNYKKYCKSEGKSKACEKMKVVFDRQEEGESLDYRNVFREAKKMLVQHAKGESKEDEQDQEPKE